MAAATNVITPELPLSTTEVSMSFSLAQAISAIVTSASSGLTCPLLAESKIQLDRIKLLYHTYNYFLVDALSRIPVQVAIRPYSALRLCSGFSSCRDME